MQGPSSREERLLWLSGQDVGTRDAKQAAKVTRNRRDAQFTIERLAHDCLDIRELRRRGFLTDRRVEIGPSIRWSKIARMTIERYRIHLNFWRQATQYVCVSWTKVHLGGARPWMHCPHCAKRVAKLYAGLGGYFCRACIGNPPYASRRLSAQGRARSSSGPVKSQILQKTFHPLDKRTKLGLGGYFCRACIGNPPYASRRLSAQGRARSSSGPVKSQILQKTFHPLDKRTKLPITMISIGAGGIARHLTSAQAILQLGYLRRMGARGPIGDLSGCLACRWLIVDQDMQLLRPPRLESQYQLFRSFSCPRRLACSVEKP